MLTFDSILKKALKLKEHVLIPVHVALSMYLIERHSLFTADKLDI
jgi:hypothetical protein